MIYRRHNHSIPGLNTASLPDLIFTVLFFFMIVTHMRKVTVRVKYRVPQGTELTRLTKKSAVSTIYIGRPVSADGLTTGQGIRLQLNDKVVSMKKIVDYLSADKDRMSAEDRALMTVSLRADRNTPMRIISDVKQALRQAGISKINYSATEKSRK
uniref:Biopolymer transporter ExbD n=1 Tax=Prevotella sp. GTC17259 TaxID=3236795 RepID=A0AB33J310_9BACT